MLASYDSTPRLWLLYRIRPRGWWAGTRPAEQSAIHVGGQPRGVSFGRRSQKGLLRSPLQAQHRRMKPRAVQTLPISGKLVVVCV